MKRLDADEVTAVTSDFPMQVAALLEHSNQVLALIRFHEWLDFTVEYALSVSLLVLSLSPPLMFSWSCHRGHECRKEKGNSSALLIVDVDTYRVYPYCLDNNITGTPSFRLHLRFLTLEGRG